MKRFVIYHNDADGQTAAAIAGRFNGHRYDEIVYIPVDYHDPVPDLAARGFEQGADEIWLVDFSFKKEGMHYLLDAACSPAFVWFDHHADNMAGLEYFHDHLPGIRQAGTAACMLVWRWCYPGRPAPWPVELIADRDVWAFTYSDMTRYFYEAYISSALTHPKCYAWDVYLAVFSIEELSQDLKKGEMIYGSRMAALEFWAKTLGRPVSIDINGNNYRAFKLNYPGSGDLGDIICKKLGYDIAWCYCDVSAKDGTLKRKHSLYSHKGIRVIDFCVQRGGGGHPEAAGFFETIDIKGDK